MYTPPQEILERYADVLVNFALNGGKGIKPRESVLVNIPEVAKAFYLPLQRAILKAGAFPIINYQADNVAADYFEYASDEQLDFFADKQMRGLIDQIDHLISIIGEADKFELQKVDAKKIMRQQNSRRPFMDWRAEKEGKGLFSWTVALFGTPAMAADVQLSEEEYWDQIIQSCFLNEKNPIEKWRETYRELERVRLTLNELQIESVHVEAEGIDLTVKLGKNRAWLGGGGRNIPSFELFISPDWRGTEGEIFFNESLYRYGNLFEGIKLRFEKGVIVESSATRNEALLKEMIASENADKIGEFSLTDKRFSRISKLMGETLFDENFGGEFGNTHIALGNAYRDSYPGDESTITAEQWEEWGFNRSPVHTDIISTTPRTVTATLPDGSQKIIYKNGLFQV